MFSKDYPLWRVLSFAMCLFLMLACLPVSATAVYADDRLDAETAEYGDDILAVGHVYAARGLGALAGEGFALAGEGGSEGVSFGEDGALGDEPGVPGDGVPGGEAPGDGEPQGGCTHVHDEECGYVDGDGCRHEHDESCGGAYDEDEMPGDDETPGDEDGAVGDEETPADDETPGEDETPADEGEDLAGGAKAFAGIMPLAVEMDAGNLATLESQIAAYGTTNDDVTITVTADIIITEALTIPVNTYGKTLTIRSDSPARTLARGRDNILLFTVGKSGSNKARLVLENIIVDGGGIEGVELENNLVSVNGGEFTMNEGAVLKNNIIDFSGAVIVWSGGKFTMNGGEISNNQAIGGYDGDMLYYGEGGGVYVDGSGPNVGSAFEMKGGSITGNTAKDSGGGVFIFGGKFSMSGGEISNNTSAYGGGVYVKEGHYQSAYSAGDFAISGGEISENNATVSGGGVYANGSTVVINGEAAVKNNEAVNAGGGLYMDTIETNNKVTALTMSGGEISGNSADGKGGGIYLAGGTVNISGGTLGGNTAGYGGGAYIKDGILWGSSSNVSLSGSFTVGNTAAVGGNTAVGDGGGVYMESGAFNLNGGAVSGNSAGDYGGGVYMDNGAFSLSGGAVSGNSAGDYGGGVYMDNGAVFKLGGSPVVSGNTSGGAMDNICLEDGSYITLGKGTGSGGNGMIVPASGMSIGVHTFTAGGVIVDSGANVDQAAYFFADVEGQKVVHRSGKLLCYDALEDFYDQVAAYGAATINTTITLDRDFELDRLVNVPAPKTAGVTLTIKSDNTARTVRRGFADTVATNGLFVVQSGARLSLDNIVVSGSKDEFAGNAASLVRVNGGALTMANGAALRDNKAAAGGGVYLNGGLFSMNNNSSISGNEAAGSGGGVYSANGTLNITDGAIGGNKATGSGDSSGGGVYMAGGSLTLNNSSINGNDAAGSGGGVYAQNVTLNITGGTIDGNKAASGGGGVYLNGGSFTMNNNNNSISDNEAVGGSGGGVYSANCTLKITGGTIDGNKTAGGGSNGGGVYLDGGTHTMNNVSISGNEAAGSGGGVHSANGTLTITGGAIDGNKAAGGGGGAYLTGGSFTMNNSNNSISDNEAVGGPGGGVYSANCTLKITGGTIDGNKAATGGGNGSGGGVYLDGGSLATNDCSISNNEVAGLSTGSGGGVHSSNAALNITGGAIDGNTATGPGGGVYLDGGTHTMNNVSVSENEAAGDGGGIHIDGGTLTITGGAIDGNTASGPGGGVYLNGGSLTTSNNSISENQATGSGGGVYLHGGSFTTTNSNLNNNEATATGGGLYAANGTLNITGGAIAGNKAVTATGGAGVYVAASAFTLGGAAVISGNTAGGAASNVFLGSGQYISLGTGPAPAGNGVAAPTPGMDVGLRTATAGGVVVNSGAAAAHAAYFSADENGKGVAYYEGRLFITDSVAMADFYNKIASYASATENMTITLSEDLELDRIVKIPAPALSGPSLTIKSDGTARTLTRGFPDAEKANGLFVVPAGASLVFDNITVTGNKGAGALAANAASLVRVNGGAFTMTGGAVLRDNRAASGGGVYLSSGSFTLNNGSISNNESTGADSAGGYGGGGGVYVAGGSFTLNNGSISGNVSAGGGSGGGVYAANGSFTITSGTVSGNNAASGGGVYLAGGDFKMSSGSVSGNTATSAYGGGVYAGGSTVSLGGTAVVSGNTAAGSAASNLCLEDGVFITLGTGLGGEGNLPAPAQGLTVGVQTKTASGLITTGPVTSQAIAGYFPADEAGKITAFRNNQLLILKDISGAVVTPTGGLVYNGVAQTPSFEVKLGGTTLEQGAGNDYTVSGSAVNAGDHTAVITGSGVYGGTISKAYTIAKAVYGGEPKNVDKIVRYGAEDQYTIQLGVLNPGVPDGLTGSLGSPVTYAIGSITNDYGIIKDTPAVSGGALTVNTNEVSSGDGKTAVINIIIISQNYENISATVTLQMDSKDDVSGQISFEDGSAVYNGGELAHETASLGGGFTPGADAVWTYIYAVGDDPTGNEGFGPNGKPVNAGNYRVIAAYEDAGSMGEKEAAFIVGKASQKTPAPPVVEGRTDTSVTLIEVAGTPGATGAPGAEYRFSQLDSNGEVVSESGWQSDPVFTGLDRDTEYSFAARMKGDANHFESGISGESERVRTFKTIITKIAIGNAGAALLMKQGNKADLTVVHEPTGVPLTKIEWTSNNPSVAMVQAFDGTGLSANVIALAPGAATIVARLEADGDIYDFIGVTVTADTAPAFVITDDRGLQAAGRIVDDVENKEIQLTAKGAASIEEAEGAPAISGVTWKSSDTKVATVNKTSGKVTYKGQGTTTITATCSKAPYKNKSASVALTIIDTKPRLPLGTISVITLSDGTVFTALPTDSFSFRDIMIEKAVLSGKAADVKDGFVITDAGDNDLTTYKLAVAEGTALVKKGKYILTLRATGAPAGGSGEPETLGSAFTLTVNVTTAVPKPKVKIPTLNSFYKEASSNISFTGSGLPRITDVELLNTGKKADGDVLENFGLEYKGGVATITTKEVFTSLNSKKKTAVKGKLRIHYEGYGENFCEIAVTVPIKDTAPKLVLTPKTQTINKAIGWDASFEVAGGELLAGDDGLKLPNAGDNARIDTVVHTGAKVTVTLKENAKATNNLQMSVWLVNARKAITIKPVIKTAAQTSYKLSSSTITLNSKLLDQSLPVLLLPNQSNVEVTAPPVIVAPTTTNGVTVAAGSIPGKFAEMEVFVPQGAKAGSYVFKVTPAGSATALKLTVKVVSGAPAATVKASGNIDLVNRENTKREFTPTIKNTSHKITGVEVVQPLNSKGKETPGGEDMFDVEWNEDTGKAELRALNGDYKKGASYKLRLVFELEGGDKVATGNITVKPAQSKVKHSLPKTATLFQSRLGARSHIVIDLTPSGPAGARVAEFSLKSNPKNAYGYLFDRDRQKLYLWIQDGALVKPGKTSLTFNLEYEGQGTENIGTKKKPVEGLKPVGLKQAVMIVG